MKFPAGSGDIHMVGIKPAKNLDAQKRGKKGRYLGELKLRIKEDKMGITRTTMPRFVYSATAALLLAGCAPVSKNNGRQVAKPAATPTPTALATAAPATAKPVQPPAIATASPGKMRKLLVLDSMGRVGVKRLIITSDANSKLVTPLLIIEGKGSFRRLPFNGSPLKETAHIEFDEVSFQKPGEKCCPDPAERARLLADNQILEVTDEVFATLSRLYDELTPQNGATSRAIKIRIERRFGEDGFAYQIRSVQVEGVGVRD